MAWDALAAALLPDEIEPFREARSLLLERQAQFLARGNDALPRLRAIDERLADIRAEVAAGFPLSPPQVEAHRAAVAEHVLALHDIEAAAVAGMREAMGGGQ